VDVDVITDIVIAKPRQTVATYAANPDNVPHWYVNIKSVEWKTPPRIAVGSKIAFVAQFLGRRLAYTYEFLPSTKPCAGSRGKLPHFLRQH